MPDALGDLLQPIEEHEQPEDRDLLSGSMSMTSPWSSVSEGALANLLKWVKARFDEQGAAIAKFVAESAIVCRDETSARVEGQTWWEPATKL